MADIRTKFAILLVVLGLGGLGGFAMGSNPARDAQTGTQTALVATRTPAHAGAANAPAQPVSTHSSGSVATGQPAASPVANRSAANAGVRHIETD